MKRMAGQPDHITAVWQSYSRIGSCPFPLLGSMRELLCSTMKGACEMSQDIWHPEKSLGSAALKQNLPLIGGSGEF